MCIQNRKTTGNCCLISGWVGECWCFFFPIPIFYLWMFGGHQEFPLYLQHEAPTIYWLKRLFAGNLFDTNWSRMTGSCLWGILTCFCLSNSINFGSYFAGVKITLQKKPTWPSAIFVGFYRKGLSFKCTENSLGYGIGVIAVIHLHPGPFQLLPGSWTFTIPTGSGGIVFQTSHSSGVNSLKKTSGVYL